MLNKIAEQQLRKAGWYAGRKIDITKQVTFLESLGYVVFDKAREFLEEYGQLNIMDKIKDKDSKTGFFIDEQTTNIEKILVAKRNYNLDEEAGERTIPVLEVGGQVIEYIGESGKIYNDCGLTCDNSEQLWNEYYGEDFGFILYWEELAAGKTKREMAKKG